MGPLMSFLESNELKIVIFIADYVWGNITRAIPSRI